MTALSGFQCYSFEKYEVSNDNEEASTTYHGQVGHRQHPERVDVPEQSVVRQKLAQREQGEGAHQVQLQRDQG